MVRKNRWQKWGKLRKRFPLIVFITILISLFSICFISIPVNRNLTNAIESAIWDRIALKDTAYVSQAHHILLLQTNHDRQTVTVYLIVTASRYRNMANGLEEYGGVSGIPTAITFKTVLSGEYELESYWEARDGLLYFPSIEEAFPTFARLRLACYPSGILLTIRDLKGWWHSLVAR